MIKKHYFYGTIAGILLLASSYFAWAVISGETLMNVQDSSITGSLISPRRVKDAGNIGDSQTAGILPAGLMNHNGTNWDKVKGDTTNGLWVNIKNTTAAPGNITGTKTPADGYTNPTDAINSWSLSGLFNGTTWDRWLSTTHGDNITTTKGANVAAILYGWDGTNYDRIEVVGDNADAIATSITGHLETVTHNTGFNGTAWDRYRSIGNNSDGASAISLGVYPSASFSYMFNGTSFDRMRGDITNGLDVDVTRIGNTGADNSTNSTSKLPVLVGRANVAAPTWTEGNQVPLSIDLSGNTRIIGTVTANAGTNLNTSALALETGGNLATIAAKDFATQTTLALIKAKTDNLDVLLSTRLKPADTLVGVTTVGTVTTITNTVPVLEQGSTNYTYLGTTTTVAFVNTAFGFTSKRILFTNDSANTIQISFDAGTTVHFTFKAGETVTFDNLAKTQLAVKSTAGGDAFRMAAW